MKRRAPGVGAWQSAACILLAGALAGGCRQERRGPDAGPPVQQAPAAIPSLEQRLSEGVARMPAPDRLRRDPFHFEAARAPDARSSSRALPPAETLPELPMPLSGPPVRLLGIAEDKATRTAVLSVGGDLVLAKEGDQVAGHFQVVRITQDSVELSDSAGSSPIRLALR